MGGPPQSVIFAVMEWYIPVVYMLIPSIMIAGVAYFMMKALIDKEAQKSLIDLRKSGQKQMLPVRVQAFERLVLLMERITPQQLVVRVSSKGKNAAQYHQLLRQTIRTEFEHNLAQQIFVSDEAWGMVKTAKDTVLNLINRCAGELDVNSTGDDLAQLVIEQFVKLDAHPTYRAISFLKKELKTIF